MNATLLRRKMVGNQPTNLAFACKSAARSGMAILTEAIPSGPIKEPRHTTISAIVVAGSGLNKVSVA